jgi:hypothetical protein
MYRVTKDHEISLPRTVPRYETVEPKAGRCPQFAADTYSLSMRGRIHTDSLGKKGDFVKCPRCEKDEVTDGPPAIFDPIMGWTQCLSAECRDKNVWVSPDGKEFQELEKS